MAVTVKHTSGKADEAPTPTGTVGPILFGPPPSGNPNKKGLYVAQIGGATGTYRFIEEIWIGSTASPSAWSYA